MATPQGRRLGYEQVSDQEPPDSRPCVLTTTLLGGVRYSVAGNLSRPDQDNPALFHTWRTKEFVQVPGFRLQVIYHDRIKTTPHYFIHWH